MNDRSVIRVKLEDDCELPGWAERMIADALQQPDFRAEVAAALEKLRDTMQVALTEDEINAATVRKNIIGELDAINATLGLKEKEGAKPLSE